MKRSVSAVALVLQFGAAGACGRSEKVGWPDRDPPLSAATGTAEGEQTAQAPAAVPDAAQRTIAEYQQLARALETLLQQALDDEELTAEWTALVTAVDARIVANSSFHQQLMQRKAEIEERVRTASEQGITMSQEEMATLGRHYQNIAREMDKARNIEFNRPEFSGRFEAIQSALFEKMRQLDPARTLEIDRLEMLETQLRQLADSMAKVPK